MRWYIEDTDTGFKMGYVTTGGTRVEAEVEGSHSEIANIYGQAERAFDVERRHNNVHVVPTKHDADPDVARRLESRGNIRQAKGETS